jgi:hypothetical protein
VAVKRIACLCWIGYALASPAAAPDAKSHWAFQPPVRPSEPAVRNTRWVRTPIDRFVLARLEEHGLAPSPEADRATLLRRLSFDLLGLPPSPQELAAFLADESPEAYEHVVERLLQSPHYGERWGRHWLDVVAYADSNGYFSADSDRPLAWRYRDYVVRSLNADKPLDQFVREQLAGDELAGYTKDGDVPAEAVDLLVATHLLRNAPDGTGESDGNAAELRADRYAVLEGSVQILGSAFFGLTVQCARCHDHKFEPFTQDDYYGLQAVLKPVYDHDHWLKPAERIITTGTRQERESSRRALEVFDRELKAMKDSLEALTGPYRKLAQQEAFEKLPEPLRAELNKALETKEKDRNAAMKALLKTNQTAVTFSQEDLARRFPEFARASTALAEAIRAKEAQRPPALSQLAVATDVSLTPAAHQVLRRGNYADPVRPAPPAAPAIFGGTPFQAAASAAADPKQGEAPAARRRLAFARWVTSTQNPVFARLMVNRAWQGHFGAGLVTSTDNFGVTGAKPTHPELLDWLATGFVESGYHLKAVHRWIVKSAAYRQSSRPSPEAAAMDPENRWLWRYPLRRLDAESIRDAMLSVTGEIDLQMGGPPVAKDITEDGQVVVNETKPGAMRRSIYLQQQRTRPVTIVDVFDGVKFTPNCVQRTTSTISLQSLAMMNSDFARARGRAFGRRLLREAPGADARVESAFALAVGRKPSPVERTAAREFLEAQEVQYAGQPDQEARVWADFGQMLLAGNSFLYVE